MEVIPIHNESPKFAMILLRVLQKNLPVGEQIWQPGRPWRPDLATQVLPGWIETVLIRVGPTKYACWRRRKAREALGFWRTSTIDILDSCRAGADRAVCYLGIPLVNTTSASLNFFSSTTTSHNDIVSKKRYVVK